MDILKIEGRHSLKGEIEISGAKNAALPALAASILCNGRFIFKNVPNLKDITTFIQLLRGLGLEVDDSRLTQNTLIIDTKKITSHEANYDLVRTMRASVLVLGPLMARHGKARISLPGGCAIGARPIDLHLKGLELMGAKLHLKDGYIEARCSQLKGTEIYFDTVTVTGTENLMMAAVLSKGKTVLKNAAREPEVVFLGEMLSKMGAKIKGLGTSVIEIEGVKELKPVEIDIIPDRVETGTYLMAVAATGGEAIIKKTEPQYLQAVISKLREMGITIEEHQNEIYVKRRGALQSVDIKTMPYPGFPTDLQAQIMVLLSISNGLSVVHETIFENRFMHVGELLRMGANIKVEGNRAIVKGVKELVGAPVMATDLRASACLVIAGLVAKGNTTISRIYHLDRGYEKLEYKLQKLGAKIHREKTDQLY